MKTKTTIVTVWKHPDSEQRFIVPGNIEETRESAIAAIQAEHEDADMSLITGREEQWSDEQLGKVMDHEG